MQIWAEPEKAALPICNYSQILYQFLTFTQNLKRSPFWLYDIRRFIVLFRTMRRRFFANYIYLTFTPAPHKL